jgi:hypothetical protein
MVKLPTQPLLTLAHILFSPVTSTYRRISTALAEFKNPYDLFFAKAYQHLLLTNFLSLAIAWLFFTTYPIILFSLYAKIQQQVISSAISAVHATCIDLLAVILCKNYITESFNHAFRKLAVQLSTKWTNEVDTERSVDALGAKKRERNTPRPNIDSFCSSFIELNKQLLQNLNKVSLAVLFILHYCNPSTFLAFLGCILCFYFVLSHINEAIKKLKNTHIELDNKAIFYNEDSKHQLETYVGNTNQNDNRCNIIMDNNIEIAETKIKVSELEKWRDWIADSLGNSITPFIIGFGLEGFRTGNIGVGILFQIIQAFERCCNLFTQNGSLSTKLQSSFSVAEKLPTYWHDREPCSQFHKRSNQDLFLTTLYTANLTAIASLALHTLYIAHSFSTANPGTHIFLAIYQTLSPYSLAAGLGLTAFHTVLRHYAKTTLSRPINTDIARLALALTGLLCILSNSTFFPYSLTSMISPAMVILAASMHLVLSWSFRLNETPETTLDVKQPVLDHTQSSCIKTQVADDNPLTIAIKGTVKETGKDGKESVCLSIPKKIPLKTTSPRKGIQDDYLRLEAGRYFGKGDMGSGKSTLAKRLLFQSIRIAAKTEKTANIGKKLFGKGHGSIVIQHPSTVINIFKPQEGDSTGTVKRPIMSKELLTKLESYRSANPKFSQKGPNDERQHTSVTELQKYFYLDLISNNELPQTFDNDGDEDSRRTIRKNYPKVQLLDQWEKIHENMLAFLGFIDKLDPKVKACFEEQSLEHIENENNGNTSTTSGGNRCAFNAACIYAMLKIRIPNITFSIFLDEPFNGSGDCRPNILIRLADAAAYEGSNRNRSCKPLLFVIAHEINDTLVSDVFDYKIAFNPVNNNAATTSGKTGYTDSNQPYRSFELIANNPTQLCRSPSPNKLYR